MELGFLLDPMTRFRALSVYPTWEETNTNYTHRKSQASYKDKKTDEKNCSICQQKKKRVLSDYIKSKQMDCRNSTSIREEDEDADEMGDSQPVQGKQLSRKE